MAREKGEAMEYSSSGDKLVGLSRWGGYGEESGDRAAKVLFWQQGVPVFPQQQSGTDPPGGVWVKKPIDQDPFPEYDTEPVLFYANA